jgi:hypothetical protein
MDYLIPCQNCGKMLPDDWHWFTCSVCKKRLCPECFAKNGYKCKDCPYGHYESNQ